MNYPCYSLTPLNLALDGTLEQFVDLYNFTKAAYLEELEDNPHLILNNEYRDIFNSRMIPKLLLEYESLVFRRLRIFTLKFKNIHLSEKHFKRFDFFDPEKAKTFNWSKEYYLKYGNREEIKKYNDPLFTFHETFIDLEKFLDQFRLIVARAIREEVQKTDPDYTIFQAINDVDSRIQERMKMRRSECIALIKDHPPTKAPLYLYDALKNTSCKKSNHTVVAKKYYAKHTNGKQSVILPAHYCKDCNKYLFGSQSLSFFKEFCGDFIIQTHYLFQNHDGFHCFTGESKLHELGYNVVAGKLSVYERQNKLISILESKQLTFFEIVSTIEQNIRIFGNNPNMKYAVSKWREDLQFINEYVLQLEE